MTNVEEATYWTAQANIQFAKAKELVELGAKMIELANESLQKGESNATG